MTVKFIYTLHLFYAILYMPIDKRLSNSTKLYAVMPDVGVSPPRGVGTKMGGDWAVPYALHDVFMSRAWRGADGHR